MSFFARGAVPMTKRKLHLMPFRRPTLLNRGGVTYFFDGDGTRWRVYDSVDEPEALRPFRQVKPVGDHSATVRCFVPADRTAPHYAFTFRSEVDREASVERFAEQLAAARPFFRRRYDSNSVEARRQRGAPPNDP